MKLGEHIEPRETVVFNPAFVRRVHAKRREEKRLADIREQLRAAAERVARIEAAREVERAARMKMEGLAANDTEDRSKWLRELETISRPLVRDLIAAIEIKHGLPAGSVIGKGRRRQIIAARFEAIATARTARPDLSLPQLGRMFQRDHTTVLHALRKMGLPLGASR